MAGIISIYIPGEIQPFERGERFTEPLQSILKHNDLGEVFEERTYLEKAGNRHVVKGCQIEIEVKHLRKGVAMITKVLRELRTPGGTMISFSKR